MVINHSRQLVFFVSKTSLFAVENKKISRARIDKTAILHVEYNGKLHFICDM